MSDWQYWHNHLGSLHDAEEYGRFGTFEKFRRKPLQRFSDEKTYVLPMALRHEFKHQTAKLLNPTCLAKWKSYA